MPGTRPAGEIYIPLAVAFASDPKVRALAQYGADAGLARDLFVQMACHCKANLTDGFVAEYELGILVYPLDVEHGKQLAKQLASVGLIKDEAGGWQVLAYLRRNGSREDVETLSKVRAEAGSKGGSVSRKPARQKASQARGKQVANQGASNYPPIDRDRVIDKDSDAELPYGSSGADAPDLNPGPIVAAFVEGATGAGLKRPAASILARVGKQARALLAERTHAPDALVESARRMGAGEWNDLAVQVRKDDAASNGKSPGGHTPYRNPDNQDDYDGELRAR
jgi:hypothetical protein